MKIDYKKHLDKLLVLGITFAVGFMVNQRSENFPNAEILALNQEDELPSKISRDPAAIKRTYDFSNLEGSALDYATKQRLIDGMKVIKDQKDIGIGLGHFVLKGSTEDKVFACQRYSKITLTFEGDGAAVAGELPLMEVEGPCEISADINSISPVWIPTSQFLNDKPSDGEYDFKSGHISKIRFSNISDSWPKTWVLRSVKLQDGLNQKGDVSILGSDLQDILKKPFIVNF